MSGTRHAPRVLGALCALLGCAQAVLSLCPNFAHAQDEHLDRVRVPDTKVLIGSTLEQIVHATEACSMQAGSACSLEEYSHELSTGQAVVIQTFWMDRYEVSTAQYLRCVKLGRCRAPRYQHTTPAFQKVDWPVVLVSSHDAASYCATQGGTLPSEQQFEAAAGGARGRIYPWGNFFHSRLANFGMRRAPFADSRDGYELLAPVTALPLGRTPLGIQHLAGNVAEWTSSTMAPHDTKLSVPGGQVLAGPKQPRVVKGGSFRTLPVDQRVQARRAMAPDDVAVDVGFRCVYPSTPSN